MESASAVGLYAGNRCFGFKDAFLSGIELQFLEIVPALESSHGIAEVKYLVGQFLAEEAAGCEVFNRSVVQFKRVGGIKKGHPTEEEIQGAVQFYEGL